MRKVAVGVAVGSIALFPGYADAADVEHVASITFSPIHLVLPVVELTGELRLQHGLSVAAIAGVGSVTLEQRTMTSTGFVTTDKQRFSVWELGGQFRWYPIGSFDHGMQLGVEFLYAHVSGTSVASPTTSGVGSGFAVGPFIGYKIATNIGFTFDAQLGVEWIGARATAKDSATGDANSTTSSAFIPLVNLNVGWSF